MKTPKIRPGGLVGIILELIAGILLLIDPARFTSGIIIAAGILLICAGLVSIVKYFMAEPVQAAMSQQLFKGLLGLLLGGFCIAKSSWFVITFPVLTVLYGVVVMISGLGKVQWAVDVFRIRRGKWFLPAISALISLVFSGVILANPFSSTAILWTFTGVAIVVEAVCDLIAFIFGRNADKNTEAAA